MRCLERESSNVSTRSTAGTLRVTTIRLPARSPNLNAHAERFVLSIKSECLNHVVPLGERHLRLLVSEYVAHYHFERPHQALDNAPVVEKTHRTASTGAVRRHRRLGGLLNHYERAAA